jgi:hypothetical protein
LAARNLYQVLKRYGRVIKQNYVSKKVNIKTILDHLEGDMNLEVKALKAEGWMASVASAWKEFNDLIRQREFQSNDKPSDNFRQIRPKIEAIWHLIAQILNSGAVINQSPEYITLIDKLNPMIASLNHTYHRIRYSIADAEMISIKPLCYTGQAHTPVPEVLYMMPQGEISQLQLGKDFNVIYKDNINPGNATCTIQGKGRYKGSRSVTFFIEG